MFQDNFVLGTVETQAIYKQATGHELDRRI